MIDVSVIMPIYNTPIRCVKDAIESIFKQVHDGSVELSIFNDGSTENYSEHLERFLDSLEFPDSVHLVYSKSIKNTGVGNARDSAIRNSSGEYIILLDSDDILHPETIKKCTHILNNHKKIQLVYSNLRKVSRDLKQTIYHMDSALFQIHHEKYKHSLNDPILHTTFILKVQMFRKEAYLNLGGYNFRYSPGEEIEFCIRLSLSTNHINIYPINDELYIYRDNPLGVYTKRYNELVRNIEDAILYHAKKMDDTIFKAKRIGKIRDTFVTCYAVYGNNGQIKVPYIDYRNSTSLKICRNGDNENTKL